MKLRMILQVWLHKSHCCQSQSELLTLSTLWLCSILMSQSSLISFIHFQRSDHTSRLNDAKCSGAQRSRLTFIAQKPKSRGQWIAIPTAEIWLTTPMVEKRLVRPMAEKWFGSTEQHFLVRLVFHAQLIFCWYITCQKWISCYFRSYYYIDTRIPA